MNEAADILRFWFGARAPGAPVDAERFALWFMKNPDTDQSIRERFEADVLAAAAGERDAWGGAAESALALIVLLDQFPRNIYRDTPRAFAFDDKALALSLDGRARGFDLALDAPERGFFYLPMEHAESAEMQERSVAAFARLAEEAPPEHAALTQNFHDYAVRHRDVIARFGRYPHRNAILGRPSTPEEIEFLKEPGSSF